MNHELGGLKRFRADLAMAFIWKGVKTLSSNSSLATVLPAPLFETDSGEKWRDAIKSREKYCCFWDALPATGSFVTRPSTGHACAQGQDFCFPARVGRRAALLVAKSGSEDAGFALKKRLRTLSVTGRLGRLFRPRAVAYFGKLDASVPPFDAACRDSRCVRSGECRRSF